MSRISVSNNTSLYKTDGLPHGCELADRWIGVDKFEDFLKISPMTVRQLNKRCKSTCNVYSCEQCYEKHKLAINMAIRKKQYDSAIDGDVACLYYIGKNLLKDTEKAPENNEVEDRTFNITILGGDQDLEEMQKELNFYGKVCVILKNELLKHNVNVDELLKSKGLVNINDKQIDSDSN